MRPGSATGGRTPRPSTSARRCASTAAPAARSLPCWRSWLSSAGWVELGRARQRQRALAVDVLLEMVGQLVERGLDLGPVVEGRRTGAQALQPMAAVAIVGEQAMDVAADDASSVGSLVMAIELQQRLHISRRAPDMHLVALEGHAVQSTRDFDQDFVAFQHGLDLEQA